MRAPTGNMANVYAEFWRMQDIADEVEPQINQVVRASGSMEAEIGEGTSADWYLVHAYPGDDVRAMRWLARRMFGVFRPMQQRTYKPRGIPVQGWEAVFPGWLFAYVWDMKKLKQRVLACPGVMGILCDPVTGNPIPIDQPDEDGVHFVDKLRARAWVYKENAPLRTNVSVTANRYQKRRRRPGNRMRKAYKADKALLESQWLNANTLEPDQRIALLKATILAPVEVQCPPAGG